MNSEGLPEMHVDFESTRKYVAENQYVLSLPERKILYAQPRSFEPESIFWVFTNKLKSFRGLVSYFRELAHGWRWLLPTFRAKDSGKGRAAIVIGNGPSQGYLTEDALRNFSRRGGDIFVVNFWNENKVLSTVVPTYIVLSDPATLNFDDSYASLRDKNLALLEYINRNKSIKILCTVSMCQRLVDLFGKARLAGFIDSEFRGWSRNVWPIFPRSYISMTLYKALAIAVWNGYQRIFVIGMDNTYPRTIFSDSKNRILNLETHAGAGDYVADQTDQYRGVGDLLVDLARLFFDARLFSRFKNIINLDPYSLTDAFCKVSSINAGEELKLFSQMDDVS